MSAAPEPARPRRRFGLRLWGLMVVVLAVGLWLGWLKQRLHSQREAVDAVERAGGWIHYDYEKENSPNRRPYGPAWVYQLVGPDSLFLFSDVVEVRFLGMGKDDEPVDDSLMPYLSRFSKLERITLGDPHRVTGSSLRHFRDLTRLEVLEIPLTRLSDGDLSNLSDLKRLRVLEMGFAEQPAGPGIGDAGLRHLAGLSELEELGLSGHHRITDAGLAHLTRSTKLESLELDDSQVTDAGLVYLRGLANLTRLCLSGTRVTDEGMAEISRLQLLEGLDLRRTAVSASGKAALKKALPGLHFLSY